MAILVLKANRRDLAACGSWHARMDYQGFCLTCLVTLAAINTVINQRCRRTRCERQRSVPAGAAIKVMWALCRCDPALLSLVLLMSRSCVSSSHKARASRSHWRSLPPGRYACPEGAIRFLTPLARVAYRIQTAGRARLRTAINRFLSSIFSVCKADICCHTRLELLSDCVPVVDVAADQHQLILRSPVQSVSSRENRLPANGTAARHFR